MAYTTNIKTQQELRNQLKGVMDNFTSFYWGEEDMWNTYGAFVVGGKDALKFNNGPSFKNQYTTPQFATTGSILNGVSFDTWKIDFTMGVYAFTIAEYRKLIQQFDAYEVRTLRFGYDEHYCYHCKVASLPTSTRYILRGGDNPLYYTEIKMSFEVVGEPAMLTIEPLAFIKQKSEDNKYHGAIVDDNGNWFYKTFYVLEKSALISDLPFPFELQHEVNGDHLNFKVNEDYFNFDVSSLSISVCQQEKSSPDEILSFDVLKEIPNPNWTKVVDLSFNTEAWGDNTAVEKKRSITYKSRDGVIVDANGDLITQVYLMENGERLINAFDINVAFFIPDIKTDYYIVCVEEKLKKKDKTEPSTTTKHAGRVLSYGRTLII